MVTWCSWLAHSPVTGKVAGSSPVVTAKFYDAAYPSGKGETCKVFIREFDSLSRIQVSAREGRASAATDALALILVDNAGNNRRGLQALRERGAIPPRLFRGETV